MRLRRRVGCVVVAGLGAAALTVMLSVVPATRRTTHAEESTPKLDTAAACASCHRRALKRAIAAHTGPFGALHSVTEPSGDASLDATTRRCLACHDGTAAMTGDLPVPHSGRIGGRIGERISSHPIGVAYPPVPRPGGEGDYVPLGMLDSRIQLFEGRVGCLSCHDLFSGEEKLLVMPNRESRLCYSCHDI